MVILRKWELLETWDYVNGNISTETWALESSCSGFANKVFYKKIIDDNLNNIISDSSTTQQIDELGQLVYLTYTDVTIIDDENVLIDLSGDRIWP